MMISFIWNIDWICLFAFLFCVMFCCSRDNNVTEKPLWLLKQPTWSFKPSLTPNSCHRNHLDSVVDGWLLQPHFENSVRLTLTLPKMGLGSPPGLLKTQNVIIGVKTPRIEVFFIPLKRSWSVDVQNGLAWAIWTYETQVMVERRVRSQTSSLTPDH